MQPGFDIGTKPADFVAAPLVLLWKDARANPAIDRDAMLAGDLENLAGAEYLVDRRGFSRVSPEFVVSLPRNSRVAPCKTIQLSTARYSMQRNATLSATLYRESHGPAAVARLVKIHEQRKLIHMPKFAYLCQIGHSLP